jgi:hypothetical protein
MIVSGQLASPLRLLPNPFRLDVFARAFVSVRMGARAATLPTPRSEGTESTVSDLVLGDDGPPSTTAGGRAAQSYRQVSAGHSEQIGVKA